MSRIKDARNLTMLTDFYEITMANGYLLEGIAEKEVVFDLFFRKVPDKGGFAIFAGLEHAIEYLDNLTFSKEDIAYLRGKGIFDEKFLSYLENFKFQCDIWAMEEGTPIFPGEPVIVVKGPAIQAQFIETMLLLSINYPSLIATKANRMVRAAEGRAIFEFGSRRAQSYDAAMIGARATYIGGCEATACVIADQYFGIPAVGTMAHSWVQIFDSEYEAFAAYARSYPDNCTLLVDTYDVIRSGIPNAIKVFDEVLAPMGYRPKGVRIDSGDIAYLSKKTRAMLDEAGYSDVKIIASNSLDEYIIRELVRQGAATDMFGVGENLITGRSEPVFGGVYKLVAAEKGGTLQPKIKLSESPEKITTPGFKMVYRLYDRATGKAEADYITVHDEVVDDSGMLTIFDPNAIWKQKTLSNFKAVPMLKRIYERGVRVYELPTLQQIRSHCANEIGHLWEELKRFEFPHKYYVDYSEKLWALKQVMLSQKDR